MPLMRLALALSLGAAVSLGVTRFSYGLLLPPMRDDLGWSYTLAGSMNTVNAVGYLLGALLTPLLMRRLGPSALFLWGGWLATLLMGVAGFLVEPGALLAQRLLAGVLSAFQFIAGGLLAARLAARDTARGSLLLGLYYGGAGLGIVASALAVPLLLHAAAAQAHAWAWAWWGLALLCALASAFMAWPVRVLDGSAPPVSEVPGAAIGQTSASLRDMAWLLMGYGLFGAGYIGYMTFSVALLREQGLSAPGITTYFTLLGVAVVVAPRVWASLLDRERGGGAFARLNALLAVAALLPVLASGWVVALVSGLLFGVCFLSVVASTTAFVRHNLPPAAWARGISRFTICFAVGHIVGPVLTGLISDGPGGLARGLVFSAVALAVGALFAWRQRPL
ncbi:MAG: YbfB/YjiJ family MFS transporter [Hydrogenophaga sp.]|nr:YbfB/YjiJ family MFS transporter [Hydrogenophaga sp.]NIN25556.1 YbfB/YjiJ family MFS transporter [Hydrogenophaga sp.]NIN30208.1 YbfB/YjiJ family MFS transporter [Hydrogenophaga sp.]NIN54509.1 YbfB/YjiJ family MFS transporter [Hydrogenophaga sp.]NIO50382.1 YbfB/YjiJ family MFS transporter [Hydrogenophaga sp.]